MEAQRGNILDRGSSSINGWFVPISSGQSDITPLLNTSTKKYFGTITLHIRNDMHHPIWFETGKVFVELDFRPVKAP